MSEDIDVTPESRRTWHERVRLHVGVVQWRGKPQEEDAVAILKKRVAASLRSDRERAILTEYFGSSEERLTFEELGKRLGVSRERARQLAVRIRRIVYRRIAVELGVDIANSVVVYTSGRWVIR
jgi:hypothetical protein